ncbi:MAG: DUF4392 domain-containing protein [Halioglobus sp.]|nr:DUF4392 domain-containing protein [Halioglobus sp.]
MTEPELSIAIENLLVARNPRNMQMAQAALAPGYVARAANHLRDVSGTVLIGTGFPVTGTFETDGPVGAIALYQALEALGASPVIACGPPLVDSLAGEFAVLALRARNIEAARREAIAELTRLKPSAVVAIERPGLAADGRYYNMRSEDISERCFFFDPYLHEAYCPTIGIGDGGNEIGMGNIAAQLDGLDIHPSVTRCDELVVSDVSNWGAYGLIAMLGWWAGTDLLGHLSPLAILNYLSGKGSVDGITGENTLTEDGMGPDEGLDIIVELRRLTGFTG